MGSLRHGRVALFCGLLISFLLSGGCGGGGNSGGPTPAPTSQLQLSFSPTTMNVNAGSAFQVTVTAWESGTTATPTISLGTLPSGLSSSSSFPMSVPSSGAVINFSAASNISTGNYKIPFNGTAGSATTQASFPISVVNGTVYPAYFINPLFNELGIAPGGSASIQLQLMGSSTFSNTLSVSGLPAGTSAKFNPQTIQTGGTTTLTVTANSSAPVAQNAELTVTATPNASVQAATIPLLLDVTASSGVGWTNRTTYVPTRATPFGAVYDPVHHFIYSSNQEWNRVDVISDSSRTLVKSLPIRDPRGLDISIDQKTIWVATGTQIMYGIDTATQKMTRYVLPNLPANALNASGPWQGYRVFSLADGTVLIDPYGASPWYLQIWDPVANTLSSLRTPPDPYAQWQIITRSGDGTRIFEVGGDSDETCFSYDVLSKTMSGTIQLGGYGFMAVPSPDGSKIAISDFSGFNLYDSSFNLIGPLPGDGGSGMDPSGSFIFGGTIFSSDGTKMYEETLSTGVAGIVTIDVASRQPTSISPAMPVIPVMVEMSPPFYVPTPFAIDDQGMMLGIQYHGIAFDDSTPNTNFVTNQPGPPIFFQHMDPYSGPLGGGTKSGGFGNAYNTTPDVYYGGKKGSATNNSNDLEITSPPSSNAGPVDVKMLYADGIEVYNPQFFTYGTWIQDVLISGSAPQGGVPSKLDGFGLPSDPTGDKVQIGGNYATVTSVPTQYPPLTGEQTSMFLSFNTPAGSPGWRDLTVTTSNGTTTLSKAFFFGKSVTDYPSSDPLSFILFDEPRNQLYVSAGDHIDIFSLSSNSFTGQLNPPSLGANKKFEGLALTPDGKYLLAADTTDGSMAVISPDTPANATVINIAPYSSPYPGACGSGPLFVAATNQNKAFVVTGGVLGIGCGPGGTMYLADLSTGTSSLVPAISGCTLNGGGTYLSASKDGSLVAFPGFQLYSTQTNSCRNGAAANGAQHGVSASGDGVIFAAGIGFYDETAQLLGSMGHPALFYPGGYVYYNFNPQEAGALNTPGILNDAGSLYYWAYPNYIDIVDVQHGMPKLRFALTETVSAAVSPMAIDNSGQRIFLITNKGLTIVDLGTPPLAIGHLAPATGSTGTQVTVRGSGFENGITATVGGVSASVSFTDTETIVVTLPAAATGSQDLVLHNPDGTAYTLENAITME